ncbi:MAG TPA: helix-turn-helix transcriptional regulator [Oscillatoriaceae cyanobacterium]
MPIRVALEKVLAERGMKLTELAQRTGIALNNLSILKTGKAKAIRFSSLESVCKALDCQPGDLLAYDPD